jgi:DNA-binding MarR family transcriptional regulator
MSNGFTISDNNDQQERKAYMQELQFLGQMASTETALFHQAVATSFGLGITDMKTISTLMQEGSMPAGQIAERLHLTTGAITNVIDRLEKLDLVSRTADPSDRRKVVVQVNQNKLAKMHEAYKSIGETFQQLLKGYDTEELKFLVDYYKASIELTKSEIAKVSGKR